MQHFNTIKSGSSHRPWGRGERFERLRQRSWSVLVVCCALVGATASSPTWADGAKLSNLPPTPNADDRVNYLKWINDNYRVSAEDDASPIYLDACRKIVRHSPRQERRMGMDSLLRENAESLKLLETASHRSDCFIPFVPLMDEFVERPFGEQAIQSRMLQLLELVERRVANHLEAGRITEAIEDVGLLVRIGNHRFCQPSALDYLQAVRGMQLMCDVIEDVVERLQKPDQATQLLAAIQPFDEQALLHPQLETELAKTYHRLQYHLKDTNGDGKLDAWIFRREKFNLETPMTHEEAADAVTANYHRWTTLIQEGANRKALTQAEDFGDQLDRAESAFDEFSFPRIDTILPARAESVALYRGVVLGAATRLHFLQERQWPDTIEMVRKRVPWLGTGDPFADSGDLRLATREGKPVLYSVGRNGKDDDGRADARGKGDMILWKAE
ncbi:MAG: hypothetical protein ACPGXK_03380 [Phycisphaerae bacterium]